MLQQKTQNVSLKAYRPKWYSLEELFPKDIITKYGTKAWEFLDERLLWTADKIREKFNKPCIVNTWYFGGKSFYRGYRPPECKIGAANSAHKHGRALDLIVVGISAKQIRNEIRRNQGCHSFRFIRRIEKNVDWLHFDLSNTLNDKILWFNP